MFKDDYKAAFSKVTASEETHRRILNMTKEHKKRRSVGGLMSKLLIAAVLVSLLTLTGYGKRGSTKLVCDLFFQRK